MSTSTAKRVIHVGHSPDPDDAFMFHALANDKIDTGRYEFRHELVDIETLNRRAFSGELELTASNNTLPGFHAIDNHRRVAVLPLAGLNLPQIKC